MESLWFPLLIGLLSVAALFAAVLVAGLLWAYTPLQVPKRRPPPRR
ncbi:hypothetical protein AB0F72_14190 [Actinoplanes sp. NPDC023936]